MVAVSSSYLLRGGNWLFSLIKPFDTNISKTLGSMTQSSCFKVTWTIKPSIQYFVLNYVSNTSLIITMLFYQFFSLFSKWIETVYFNWIMVIKRLMIPRVLLHSRGNFSQKQFSTNVNLIFKHMQLERMSYWKAKCQGHNTELIRRYNTHILFYRSVS